MKFSIIIPTYNESDNIAAAIGALSAQNVLRADCEIIVADNNSSDGTVEVARLAGADRIIAADFANPNSARQMGAEKAVGEIIAFLDADSQPPEFWLRKIEENLGQADVYAVSGPYEYDLDGIKKRLADFYWHTLVTKIPRCFDFIFRKKSGVILGGNFAVRREVFAKIGKFPTDIFWGDDAAIAMLISRRAGKVVFDQGLKVASSPRRLEKSGFVRLTLRYVFSYFKIYFSKKYD